VRARFEQLAKKGKTGMKRMGRYLLGAVVVWLVYCLAGGRPVPAKDEWLPISPEDLALKDNPASPGADAMILYRESWIDAKQSAFHEYKRIKIFTQAGTGRGTVEIPFLKGTDSIEDLRARTIEPDGTVVNFEGKPFEKTVVKASGYKFLAKALTLPDVRPGSIIEYKFRDQYDSNYYYNASWTLTSDLFTRYGRFWIKPDTSSYAPALMFRQYGLPSNLVPQEQKDGSYALEVHDLKGIEDEAYMPPEQSLQARVKFFYRQNSDPAQETVDQYWNRIGKNFNDGMEHFIGKRGALEAEVSRTVGGADLPEVKLRKLYARAQQIRNLTFEESKSKKEEKAENLKPNANVEDVLKRGYGNGRQINYLFVGLARAAGFESTEIFLTARNNSFFLPQVKDATQLDTDIVWVRAVNQEYFVDPSAARYPFDVLPWYEAGAGGIRISKDGAHVVDTPAPKSSGARIIRHSDLNLSEDGTLSGTVRVAFAGELAAEYREEGYSADETGRKKMLETKVQDWLPSGAAFKLTSVADWEDVDQPLKVEGTIQISGFGSPVGRRMLVPATIFVVPQAKAFQSARRVNMIYFSYPFEISDEMKLHPPEGYTVETLPAAQNVNPGAVKYEITMTKQADGVKVNRQLVVNAILIPVTSYGALRQFFNTVKSNDEAQVVFQSGQNAGNN